MERAARPSVRAWALLRRQHPPIRLSRPQTRQVLWSWFFPILINWPYRICGWFCQNFRASGWLKLLEQSINRPAVVCRSPDIKLHLIWLTFDFTFEADRVAVGDLLRAALDRALHLARRRPLHHHLRRDPPQDAWGQRRAAQDLHQFCTGWVLHSTHFSCLPACLPDCQRLTWFWVFLPWWRRQQATKALQKLKVENEIRPSF